MADELEEMTADEPEENRVKSLRHGSALKAVDVAYSNAEG